MAKKEISIRFLEQFLPEGTFPHVAPFFETNTIHLNITRERKSVLGDYRHPSRDFPYHRISINVNLNKYSFLITLLHELAHLYAFNAYKNTVSPHGKEWKQEFRNILVPFIGKGFFPKDVEKALMDYIHNPAASTCTDPRLYKSLHKYDDKKDGHCLVDEVPIGRLFKIEDGRIFEKVAKLRTRSRCKEVKTGKMYLVPGIAEVELLD